MSKTLGILFRDNSLHAKNSGRIDETLRGGYDLGEILDRTSEKEEFERGFLL